MDVARTMEFILDQIAQLAVQQARSAERHDSEIAEIRKVAQKTRDDLRRAVRLGVQEARNQRRRSQDLDEKITQLAAAQLVTEQKFQSFLDHMGRSGNGHS